MAIATYVDADTVAQEMKSDSEFAMEVLQSIVTSDTTEKTVSRWVKEFDPEEEEQKRIIPFLKTLVEKLEEKAKKDG